MPTRCLAGHSTSTGRSSGTCGLGRWRPRAWRRDPRHRHGDRRRGVAVVAGGELVDERRAAGAGAAASRERLLAEVEAAWRGRRLGADRRRSRSGSGRGRSPGLRVGIATARALGQGRGLPMAAVGSLAALARGIGERAPEATAAGGDRRAARAGLRRALRPGGEPAWGPLVAPPEELAERLAAGPPGRCGGRATARYDFGSGSSPRARRSSRRRTRRTGWRLGTFARWPRGRARAAGRRQARLSEKTRRRGMA